MYTNCSTRFTLYMNINMDTINVNTYGQIINDFSIDIYGSMNTNDFLQFVKDQKSIIDINQKLTPGEKTDNLSFS